MLAKGTKRAMRQSEWFKCPTPANAAARATGKTGKRNRNIPEEPKTNKLLGSQTILAVRQSGVFRQARTLSQRKAKGSGPKNCQKPACAWSTAAKKGNRSARGMERGALPPVSASTEARVKVLISADLNQWSKNGNTGSWLQSALRA